MLIVAGGLIGGYSDTTEVNSCDTSAPLQKFSFWHGIAAVGLFQYWQRLEGGRAVTLTKVQSWLWYRFLKSSPSTLSHQQSKVWNWITLHQIWTGRSKLGRGGKVEARAGEPLVAGVSRQRRPQLERQVHRHSRLGPSFRAMVDGWPALHPEVIPLKSYLPSQCWILAETSTLSLKLTSISLRSSANLILVCTGFNNLQSLQDV